MGTVRITQALASVFKIREGVNASKKKCALHVTSEHFDFICCWPVSNDIVLRPSKRQRDIPAGSLPCVLSLRISLDAVGVQEMTRPFQSLLFIWPQAYL